ncbi:MAG: O-antigen ligase family protein [Desulfobulbus sp.]|nr:O-antigen ligase family protein [Desulfobulbus sp.]
MTIVVYTLLFILAVFSILFPWIGVISGYFSILFGPHVIWWWAFEGSRHFLIISSFTFMGVCLSFLSKKIEFKRLFNRLNLYLFIWLFFIIISYLFGDYVNSGPGERYFQPDYILDIAVKSFLFYFISVLAIDSDKKAKYLVYLIIAVSMYYIIWINQMYLSGHYGRLGGPRGLNISQYGDQNNFAMFFVISLPFLYYCKNFIKNKALNYFIWLFIPLGWHAVFLTGSRGGLLGLAISLAPMIIRSGKRRYGVFIVLALSVVFVWQGGDFMKDRAQTITFSSERTDESIKGRLNSWEAATKMMLKHPLTGVGVASFGMAYPDFSDTDPREAHNTYFQIGAESGVFAVFCYVLFLIGTVKRMWRIGNGQMDRGEKHADFSVNICDPVLSAWIGFASCALFLSLQLFEQFFYLAVLSNYIIFQNKTIDEDVICKE